MLDGSGVEEKPLKLRIKQEFKTEEETEEETQEEEEEAEGRDARDGCSRTLPRLPDKWLRKLEKRQDSPTLNTNVIHPILI